MVLEARGVPGRVPGRLVRGAGEAGPEMQGRLHMPTPGLAASGNIPRSLATPSRQLASPATGDMLQNGASR